MSEHVPPHNDFAEMALLGAILLGQDSALKIATQMGLGVNHIWRPSHRTIYKTVVQLHEASVKPDLVAVRLALKDTLPDVGGLDYLMQVCEQGHFANPAFLVTQILDCWRIRETIKLGEDLQQGDMDSLTLHMRLDNIKEGAKGGIPDLEPFRLGHLSTKRHEGVPTGFSNLNAAVLTRGWPVGQTSMVSAYHKGGKTAFMLQSALEAAKQGYSVLYASFADLDAQSIQARIMKMETGWASPDNISCLQTCVDWDHALAALKELSFRIYSPAERRIPRDVETFLPWLEREYEAAGTQIVFLDYAQRIRSNSRKASTEYYEAGIVADLIQEAAQGFAIPMVLGAQITEGGKDGRDRTKGSRVWEENAGLVVRVKPGDSDDMREIEIPYNRFGGSGGFSCKWLKNFAKFQEVMS